MKPKHLTLDELLYRLGEAPDCSLQFALPDAGHVPVHFHVTEVGRVQKDFVDCGGTFRSTTTCVLQVWVANDLEHRLSSQKLAKIIQKGIRLFPQTNVPLEIEYDNGLLSQYPVLGLEMEAKVIRFQLGTKHAECLAPDRCGVQLNVISDCASPGCC